jgi:hypothetical protein
MSFTDRLCVYKACFHRVRTCCLHLLDIDNWRSRTFGAADSRSHGGLFDADDFTNEIAALTRDVDTRCGEWSTRSFSLADGATKMRSGKHKASDKDRRDIDDASHRSRLA